MGMHPRHTANRQYRRARRSLPIRYFTEDMEEREHG